MLKREREREAGKELGVKDQVVGTDDKISFNDDLKTETAEGGRGPEDSCGPRRAACFKPARG